VSRTLVLYEDPHWAQLSPLADLTPVPALRFGASTLAERWREVAGVPLLGLEARPDAMAAWRERLIPEALPPGATDEVLVINAAALPGAWLTAALEAPGPALFTSAGRIAGARLPHRSLAPGLGRGATFETFLLEARLPGRVVAAEFLAWPWDLIRHNVDAIVEDLTGWGGEIEAEVDPLAALYEPERITLETGVRVDAHAVLDARGGPILIEHGTRVQSHTLVIGPCAIGPDTHLLGGTIARSSIGPGCRIAGEVEESVWQGWANKRHHGFIGHSLIGEWANLGALTTTSDLKNNYGRVRVWAAGSERDSGLTKVGAVIGAHIKTGIGTLLPTGASLGIGGNLFGGGRFVPKRIAPFVWWDGATATEHRWEAFLETARQAMSRRERPLAPADETLLRAAFEAGAAERTAAAAAAAAAP
jgi:UDP-N-acetylglucosamine diphosphorylase / glucose-1-phosphate thymidylyltransferase / UDP-N-acetylgalactosamine diphosphorylase / glucosamine-1-phosphate N-acetyltransferase / galactosamine-1-phosphate N-acetyltransferase